MEKEIKKPEKKDFANLKPIFEIMNDNRIRLRLKNPLDINTKKWSETKTKLYKTLKNEIEQIENKLNKSVKSKKINKKKIINETDSDSDKVKKSKSKLKSKTKYINESDESDDFEELLEK